MASVSLYDELGADYDRFIDWPSRLALELPALEKVLAENGVRRVLDAGCGTGWHAITLARRGYEAVGADLSAAMVTRARENAAAAGVAVTFVEAGLGELHRHVAGPFDAVLCLGHSLPHLPSAAGVASALHDFAALLRPGGVLLIQNRNDERLLQAPQAGEPVGTSRRFLPLSAHREGDREWLFFRFLDLTPGVVTFHLVTFQRDEGEWRYRVSTTTHRLLRQAELETALRQAGFTRTGFYGGWTLEPFDVERATDLVAVATKPRRAPGSSVECGGSPFSP